MAMTIKELEAWKELARYLREKNDATLEQLRREEEEMEEEMEAEYNG